MGYISAIKMDMPNGYDMPEFHAHSYYEIVFLTQGKRHYMYNNRTYNLEAPALIIVPPNTIHREVGGPFMQFNIYVSPDYLDRFQQDVLTNRALQIITPLKAQNEELINVCEEMTSITDSRFRSELTHALFSYFVCVLNKLNVNPLSASNDISNNISAEIDEIIEFFNNNYYKKFSLDDIANTFFMSKSALNYKFKDSTSCTPIEFLQNIRINAAKKMLVETNSSIKNISDQCGFSSPNYFGLIFKKKTLVSPAMYRKMYHEDKV